MSAVTKPPTQRVAAVRLLAAIVETSDDAIVSKSLDGIIQTWNAGAERIFGYTAAQAVGRHISLIIPRERLKEEDLIMQRLRAGERVDHFETERVHREGRIIPVSLTISPIKDDAGHVIGASKIARDITERRRAEQALKDADLVKDRFLATLSHELRNPLAPIRAAAQLIQHKAAADPDLQQSGAVIDRQLRHMVRLLEDLLDVSRISANKLELRSAPVTIDAIVRAATEASLPMIEEAHHELVVRLPDEPLHLYGDPLRLAQVFSNLLNNAAKYTMPSGRITLRAQRVAGSVRVSVRDEGIGITADALSNIFQMFWQAAPDSDRPHGGLGIGLAISRALVELHGGSIEARSAGPNKGSEFVVTLPLLLQEAPAPLEKPARAGVTSKRRLVIVDDLRDSADSLAQLMRIFGHDVTAAYDGVAAITLAARVRPDVMLVDIGMPGMTGHQVCQHIRRQPGGENIFLVAVTGWGQPGDRQLTEAAGFDLHLVKPVDGAALADLIASLPSRPPAGGVRR